MGVPGREICLHATSMILHVLTGMAVLPDGSLNLGLLKLSSIADLKIRVRNHEMDDDISQRTSNE